MVQRILVIASGSTVGLKGERMLCPNGCELRLVEGAATGIQAAIVGGFDLVLVSQTASSPAAMEILRQIKEAPSPRRNSQPFGQEYPFALQADRRTAGNHQDSCTMALPHGSNRLMCHPQQTCRSIPQSRLRIKLRPFVSWAR